MTNIYFVRHAEPNHKWNDDRTKPLSENGLKDRLKIIELLENKNISMMFSSPYKRSLETIEPLAQNLKLAITTDEDLRERKAGNNGNNLEMFRKRWTDLSYSEELGESIKDVQMRNIEAIKKILIVAKNKNVVIGTHGTALSSILNYYQNEYGFDNFMRIINYMPYVIRLEFENTDYIKMEEVFYIEKRYDLK
jgi:2,3-bisphosphoglycerate-dependent phosphoglycerate mutase